MADEKILDFFEFVYDRQAIWHKRFVLNRKAPWTTDKILQTYRYCNVYRELDKCTEYLIKIFIDSNKPDIDVLFNIVMFRIFNSYGFFDTIKRPTGYSVEKFQKTKLEHHIIRFEKFKKEIWNCAYMICGITLTNMYPTTKHIQVLYGLHNYDWGSLERALNYDTNSLKEIFNLLKSIPFIGPFLAYQIIIDMYYFDLFDISGHDVNSFVFVGPGATKGLDIINGKKILNQNEYVNGCRFLWEMQLVYFNDLKNKRKKNWNKIYYRNSIMSQIAKTPKALYIGDIQNCLCEFRKYYNHKNIKNSRKRKYTYAK